MTSSSGGIFKLEGGRPIGYFLYNGTADVVLPTVRYSQQEVWDKRDEETWPDECECGLLEDVYLYSSYGGGFHWKGAWCPGCRRIATETGCGMPWDTEDGVTDGLPPNCEWP